MTWRILTAEKDFNNVLKSCAGKKIGFLIKTKWKGLHFQLKSSIFKLQICNLHQNAPNFINFICDTEKQLNLLNLTCKLRLS